jgi:hypothetical protein
MMHTSRFHGRDAGDINTTAGEIVSVDMPPADPYILKRSFTFKIGAGAHQYTE